jgi:hypothetical protein
VVARGDRIYHNNLHGRDIAFVGEPLARTAVEGKCIETDFGDFWRDRDMVPAFVSVRASRSVR